MAEITRPHIVWKEGTKEEQERNGRLMLDWMAQQMQKLRAEGERTYRKKSDRIVADALRVMEGEVSLDKASRGIGGQVLYLLDPASAGGYFAGWGDGTTPSPTDPGSGPNVGAPHNLLDGSQHPDTAVDAVTRGSIIVGNATPAWDELVSPGAASVLINDATDMAYRTIPATRRTWLHVQDLVDIGSTAAPLTIRGTAPDAYTAWAFLAPDAHLEHFWPVPDDWRTGTVEAFAHWTTDGAAAANWLPVFETLLVAAGGSMVAAGTTTSPAATSANFAADLRQRTSLGSFAVSAGEFHRLVVGRVPGGADTFAGTIYLIAVELVYTPIY